MVEYITTADGSVTLFHTELKEHYHSIHGAINEAKHVYIREGLAYVVSSHHNINLLEIGFGTGLNALLTSLEAYDLGVKVNYVGVEAFPLSWDIIPNLNYAPLLLHPKAEEYFKIIHTTPWNLPSYIHDNFILNKLHAKIEEVELKSQVFDLIFFDAFAPDKQPEIWSALIFRKLYNCLSEGGILVTYSSKGTVKQTLRSIGFKVERLAGPQGKWHMLRAIKQITPIET